MFILDNVNSEIIARFLIFAKRSFVKIKSSRNGEITLPFTDVGKSCSSRELLASHTCTFVVYRYSKSKIIAKISEFTVHVVSSFWEYW